MQAQIQALIAAAAAAAERETERSNMEFHMEMAKLLVFSGKAERVGEFIIVCKLYLRMKMRGATVEEQIQ